jgi:hypothetical protein
MAQAVAQPASSIAIITPWKDFWFFFASMFVVLLAWFASAVLHIDGFTILAVVAVVSNGPHLVSTWTRVYFDRREWRSRPVATVVLPLIIMALVWVMMEKLSYGARLANSVILYWATWHFVAQNWGILRIYQRKSGEPEGSMAMAFERPVLLLIVAFCMAHRLYTGPRRLFGVELYYPQLPYPLVMGLLAPLIILFVAIVVQRIRERHAPWAKGAWVRVAFIACSFVGFFVPFQLITTDDTSAFAAAACWHGFQYLGMVRHYHRNAWRNGVDPNAKLVSWLGQPGWQRATLYMMLLWSLAGAVYGVIWLLSLVAMDFYRWAAVIWVGLTLSHYWIDGVIWKLRRPELAARVGIAVPTT